MTSQLDQGQPRLSLMWTLYLPVLIVAISLQVRAPILPLFARELGASYALVGMVVAAEAVGMLLSDLPAGWVLGRLGQRRTMIVGLTFAVLAALALAVSQNIGQVILFQSLSGLGLSIFNLARSDFIAMFIPLQQRGRAVALLGGMLRVGRFVGPAIGGVTAAQLGLRAPFLVMTALLGAALVVVLAVIPPDDPAEHKTGLSLRVYLQGLCATYVEHRRLLNITGLGQLLAQMVRTGPGVIIPLYAVDHLGLDVSLIGAIMSASSALDMLLFYPTGQIMDRLGRKFAVVPSFFLQGVGLALIPLTGSAVTLGLAAGLIGLGNGLGSGTMITLGADLAPAGRRGEFLGLWRFYGDLGFTLGPLLVGGVAGQLALTAAAVMLGGAGVLTAGLFIWLVPETLKK